MDKFEKVGEDRYRAMLVGSLGLHLGGLIGKYRFNYEIVIFFFGSIAMIVLAKLPLLIIIVTFKFIDISSQLIPGLIHLPNRNKLLEGIEIKRAYNND